MADKYSTLSALFTDIADAIRGKTKGSNKILANSFPEAIRGIDAQSAGLIVQTGAAGRTVTVSKSGTDTQTQVTDSSKYVVFLLSETGNYTVKVSDGSTSNTKTIDISTLGKIYKISIMINIESLFNIQGLDKPRSDMAASSVGKYAIFGGGTVSENGNASNYVESYDSNLIHSVQSKLEESRQYLGSASIGNYALFAGGYFSWSKTYCYNTVDAYNNALTKSSVDSLSSSRYLLSGTTIGNYAIFGPGNSIYSSSGYNVDAYNKSLVKTSCTEANTGYTATSGVSNGTYAIFTNNGSAVFTYNSSLVQGTATAFPLTDVSYLGSATNIGSYALFANKNRAYYYNSSLTISALSALSQDRTGPVAITIGSYALFAGGSPYISGDPYFDTVDMYNSSLTRSTLKTKLYLARGAISATTTGAYILFAGGFTNELGNVTTVDIYYSS